MCRAQELGMLPNELMKWLLRTAQMLFQLMQQLDHPLAGIDMRIQRRIVRLLKVPPCYRSEQVCLSPQRRHVRIPDVGVELWVDFDRSPADGCAESIADEEFLFPFPVTWHGFPNEDHLEFTVHRHDCNRSCPRLCLQLRRTNRRHHRYPSRNDWRALAVCREFLQVNREALIVTDGKVGSIPW